MAQHRGDDVLVLGGYGNFGKRIAAGLLRHGVAVVLAGRDGARARALAGELAGRRPGARISGVPLEARGGLAPFLASTPPAVVVNTIGPFQGQDHAIAATCIAAGVHYVDLADGRDFVGGITRLDADARRAGVAVISGASTVPALSSAVVEAHRAEFAAIASMDFGISPGQRAERVLATTQGILGYLGRRLRPAPGEARPRHGWQDLHSVVYPGLGRRWMAACDVPDIDLLPQRYGIGRVRFSAGMEVPAIHLGMYGLSWLVRAGLELDLAGRAQLLLRAAAWFDRWGSDAGGMHVILRGTGHAGGALERRWFIIARAGDGPQIPCVPAILLARDLARGNFPQLGAQPCIGLVGLAAYLAELEGFAIEVVGRSSGA